MRLYEIVGEVAGKLHTARSRNDQVATDAKLYLRRRLQSLERDLKLLQSVFLRIADEHRRTVMPGYTHFQLAQPITLGFHYLAHFWAIQRCGRRFAHTAEVLSTCPLGSCALAGTSFPIDRYQTAADLQFKGPVPNALDATSDRSWALDVLHAIVQVDTQLGKMAHELVLWSADEYGFVSLDSAYVTGSSIMPQKRNPDIAELVRGRSASSRASYVQLASLIGHLPLGYHRDYQDDKPPVFAAISRTERMLSLIRGMLETAVWNPNAMAEQAKRGFSCVTELADLLVRRGLPFRKAHALVREIVEKSSPSSEIRREAALEVLAPHLVLEEIDSMLRALTPRKIVQGRRSLGSTGTKSYGIQLRRARQLHAQKSFSAIL
jgi:argininosuccinate lyase